ncbi:MAG: hypothetical protein ABEJ93_03055 [Candidatus Nanohalobium sp.]
MNKKKALTISLTLIALLNTASSSQQVFDLEITLHKNNTAKLNEVTIEEGEPTQYYGNPGNYSFYIEGPDSTKLWQQKRKIHWFIMTNPPTPTETLPIHLKIPYRRKASIFKITNNGNTILRANITKKICTSYDNKCSSYCKGRNLDVDCTCGDNICQEGLNERELCPSDCGVENNTKTSENNTREPEDGRAEIVDTSYNIAILAVIIIAAIAGLLFYLSGKVKIEA